MKTTVKKRTKSLNQKILEIIISYNSNPGVSKLKNTVSLNNVGILLKYYSDTSNKDLNDCKCKVNTLFNYLYLYTKPKLKNFIFNILKNNNNSNEIIDKTFLDVYENIHQYNDKYNFSTWLYNIAKNNTLLYIQKQKRINENDENGDLIIPIQNNYYYNPDYIYNCIDKSYDDSSVYELYEILLNEINSLSPRYKIIFEKRVKENKKYRELAAEFNTNIEQIKNIIFGAKKNLKKKILQKYPQKVNAFLDYLKSNNY